MRRCVCVCERERERERGSQVEGEGKGQESREFKLNVPGKHKAQDQASAVL